MKKKLLLFFAVFAFTVLLFGLLVVNTSAETYSGECGADGDNLTWTLDTNTGVLNIGGTGEMKDYYSSSSVPWYSYRSSIKSVTIGEGVTSIGSYAFYNCTSLSSIAIPSGVTRIGSTAFYKCTSLTSVHITDIAAWCNIPFGSDYFANPLYYAKKLYLNGTLVTDLVIPEGVTSIGGSAFYNCTSLTRVTIPSSVTTIGYEAFKYCTSLASVTFAEGSSLTSIDYGAFYECTSLARIEIPSSVTSIGSYSFYDCTSLASVTFAEGSSLTSIGSSAFSSCTSLTRVTIPSGVTSIGSWAFGECTSLTHVTIPSSVTSIGNDTFYYCRSLKAVYISSPTIASALRGSAYNICGYLAESYRKTFAIKSDITNVASYVKSNYPYVDTVTYLGEEYTVYSEHSHADASVWKSYTDGAYVGKKCSSCGLIKDEMLDFSVKSANVNLSSDITIKYNVAVPEGFENVYAVFTFGGNEYIVRDYTVDAKGRYVFAFTGITPQCLGDEIHFVAYATYNGVEFSAVKESYSIKEYCANLLRKYPDDCKLVIMISDLLTYGAKAQIYKNYKTDALVTEGLTLTPSSSVTLDASYNQKALVGMADESVKWKSVGLRYENTMVMYFRFYAEDVTGLSVKITINGRTSVYTASDFTDEGNGYYRIDFRGIAATEFNDTVSASFEREDIAVGQTAIYSVNSYVYLYQNSADTALADLLKATYLYGKAAELYTDLS